MFFAPSSRAPEPTMKNSHRRRLRPLLLALAALLGTTGVTAPAASASAATRHHVRIHRGDTMVKLHKRLHRPVWCLAKRNHIANPNRIRAGRRLVVPSRAWCRHHHGRRTVAPRTARPASPGRPTALR